MHSCASTTGRRTNRFARRCATGLLLAIAISAMLVLAAPPAFPAGAQRAFDGFPADYRQRLPDDELIYFLLPDRFENGDPDNDRGGLEGDRLVTGFDPTDKAFFHGGDLKGLISRLDYIQSLGATAIWLGPVYVNKPVQGAKGAESAGYHGYWITDFTRVDPHFGTNEDMKALVEAAHARGLKIYLDIITNHTADVIQYRECRDCPYRSRADYPYTRHGGINGDLINEGFEGSDAAHQTSANFARLTRPDYAYTPYIPKDEAHLKVPDWLNDPIYYHNRGNTTFSGESSEMGDFGGLDDLMTENPQVVQGFIDIYGAWIDEFGIDGFRIDTAKHVNPEFWRKFAPAMLARAAKRGIPNFHIFGEVATTRMNLALLAEHSHTARLPAVLDFNFAAAVRATVAGGAGTDELARLFAGDVLYRGGEAAALQLPTFVSNHDAGRIAWYIRQAFPAASDDEVLKRVILAHAMLLTLRGVPTIYYGDEQGFAGLGGDHAARQDMFPSKVTSYNDTPLVGTTETTATSSFDRAHPIRIAIAYLAALRSENAALRRGLQVVRAWQQTPGLFAASRFDPQTGAEYLLAFNTSASPIDAQVEINADSHHFTGLYGDCAEYDSAPGSYHVSLPPFGYLICRADAPARTAAAGAR